MATLFPPLTLRRTLAADFTQNLALSQFYTYLCIAEVHMLQYVTYLMISVLHGGCNRRCLMNWRIVNEGPFLGFLHFKPEKHCHKRWLSLSLHFHAQKSDFKTVSRVFVDLYPHEAWFRPLFRTGLQNRRRSPQLRAEPTPSSLFRPHREKRQRPGSLLTPRRISSISSQN